MRIALINASPKVKESASGALINDFLACAHGKCECEVVVMNKPTVTDEMLETLKSCESWVIFYPVYVDGVPGHILSCLKTLEGAKDEIGQKRIYAVSNCGFHDGKQCEPSLEVISHWSKKSGHIYCGGLGVGGGGALFALLNMKPGDKPKSKIDKSLDFLLKNVIAKNIFENIYANVGIPRAIYKLIAELGWGRSLVKNGKKKKDIGFVPNN